jgi:hypothetical protein
MHLKTLYSAHNANYNDIYDSEQAAIIFNIEMVFFASWTVHFVHICVKTNKYTNYSFNLLIMYGSSYMFRHYIAILGERS